MNGTNIEYASILSKSDQTSGSYLFRPTVFDLLAQENMNSLFRPAFNHLLKWLATTNGNLHWLKRYSDEIYLGIHSLVEYVYLKHYDALFSEYFYGMKRNVPLTNLKRVLSLLFSILVPYLKSKLDDYYEELEKTVQLDANATGFNKLLLKFYPYVHTAWSLLLWYVKFKFMINASDATSPLLSVLGLKLVYDLSQRGEPDASWSGRFLQLANGLFTNGLFFIQFIKWFYDYRQNRSYMESGSTQSYSTSASDEERLIIEPPKLSPKLADNKAFKAIRDKRLCPLCNKKRTNECALSVSGFVFCYTCLFKFVREHKRCPITNFPATTANIIRIYATT